MNVNLLPFRSLMVVLIASPFVAFGAYIAYLVVPVVIREVVPEVVKTVAGS